MRYTVEQLLSWYEQYGSASAIARATGYSQRTLVRHLAKAGVDTAHGFKSPKSIIHKGPDSPNWKGGTYKHSDGYIYEYAPDHPNNYKGYVLQHRLRMEEHLGRYLEPHEIVHHKDEDKAHNEISNLELTTAKLHGKHHLNCNK